ncbi:MAG: PAC2 family protein [Candidatus Micrarchaeota archaeon]|nr:PAC2 family protein [Candidatus Micrarchaeota archaeon]
MMQKTTIKLRRNAKAGKAPIAIIGMPGIGNVGKLVAENIRRELKAERIGTIYSPHFPHQAVMLKNGRLRLVNNTIYLAKVKGKPDLIIITGDMQAVTPEGQYDVNYMIFRLLKERFNCSFIYTIGGYSTGEAVQQKRRVFGNATNTKTIDMFKKTNIIFGKSKGMIWGSAGLIPAFARMGKVDAACLMGETAMLEVDAAAAKSVIEELSKVLGVKIGTDNLDKIIKRTDEIIRQLGQANINIPMPMGQMPVEGGAPSPDPGHRPSYIR